VRGQNTLGYSPGVDPGRLTLGDQNGGIPGITRPENPRGPACQVFTIAENIFPNPSRFRALGLEDREGRTGFICRPPNHGFTTLGASTHELMVSGP
jgi:hypothetical protein